MDSQLSAPVLSWVTWIKSITVLLQDKLKKLPHAGALQSGLAWTIASLCWSILRCSLACLRPLTTAWVTSFPALLHVYGVLAPNCLWYHRPWVLRVALLKRPPGWGGKNHPGLASTTSLIQETPSSVSLCRAFPSILHSSLACGTGACRWHCDSSLWWLYRTDITREMTKGDYGIIFSK